MSADVQIRRWYGSSGSPSQLDVTNLLASFYTSDDPVGAQYPIVIDGNISGGSTRQSYWTYTRLYTDTSPVTLINNIQWYPSSGYPGDWTGCKVGVVQEGTTYNQATGTLRISGSLLSSTTDLASFSSGSPLSVSGSISNPAVGDFGNFVALQFTAQPKWLNAVTQSGITSGTKSPITITWQYDET